MVCVPSSFPLLFCFSRELFPYCRLHPNLISSPEFLPSAPPGGVRFTCRNFSPSAARARLFLQLFGRRCSVQSLSDSVHTTGAALHFLLRFFIPIESSVAAQVLVFSDAESGRPGLKFILCFGSCIWISPPGFCSIRLERSVVRKWPPSPKIRFALSSPIRWPRELSTWC
jgi:hypothetical protein